jgi:hypothetical protein
VRQPGRRDELATLDRPGVDPQPVVPLPAADEALRKDAVAVALWQRRRGCFVERDGVRDIERELGGRRSRNELVAVAELERAFGLDLQRALERRRPPESDLGRPVYERREQAARVTAVRRFGGTAKLSVDHELHDK